MRIAALLCAAFAAGPALAQDRVETLTCTWEETGVKALEVVVHDWRNLDRVTYFAQDGPKDATVVHDFYDGGVVKALFANFSPALTFRLEVYRDTSEEGRAYVGMMWPIASSGAFPVTCLEELTSG